MKYSKTEHAIICEKPVLSEVERICISGHGSRVRGPYPFCVFAQLWND
jgi:hypothetical protein